MTISPANEILKIESAGDTEFCESLDILHIWWLVDGHGKDTIRPPHQQPEVNYFTGFKKGDFP